MAWGVLPAGLAGVSLARAYARHFPTVEIDSTFYGAPAEKTACRWVDTTPAAFRFACKLPREITHACRLRDCSAELNAFSARSSRSRQSFKSFSSNCRRPLLPKMADRCFANSSSNCRGIFASPLNFVMPAGIGRKSFASWRSIGFAGSGPIPARSMNEISRLLNSCRARPIFFICAYSAITRRAYDPDGLFVHRYNKLLWKREAALESWSLKIERHLAEVRNVWTFVSNHFEGFAPETCQRLAQRLGFALPLPSETERTLSEQDRSQLDLFRNDEARMTNIEGMPKSE